MQSLHRGSFCVQEWRETRRDPWNFSPYLDVVYYKAL